MNVPSDFGKEKPMKITSTLVAAGLVAAGFLGFAGTVTAESEVAPYQCTRDNACLYSNPRFTGYVRDDFYSRPNWGAIYYDNGPYVLWRGDGVSTNVSSLDNWDLDSRIAVYYNSRYRGPCFTVEAAGAVSDFRQVRLSDGSNANDRMNSHHFNRTCGPVYNF
jgi:hypothetical protein